MDSPASVRRGWIRPVDDVSRRRRVTPEVRYLNDGSAEFRVPFDAGWVATVKGIVPPTYRDWDPAAKTWLIDPPYVRTIVDLTERVFGSASGPQHPHHSAPSDPFVTLHLLPSAPPELIDGAYRVLARLHHPDVGGTHEQMLALTAAHDALKARVAS